MSTAVPANGMPSHNLQDIMNKSNSRVLGNVIGAPPVRRRQSSAASSSRAASGDVRSRTPVRMAMVPTAPATPPPSPPAALPIALTPKSAPMLAPAWHDDYVRDETVSMASMQHMIEVVAKSVANASAHATASA
eukprot:2260599-Karenia_brevis.AAC.1